MADTVDKAVYVLSYQTGDSKQQMDALKRSTDAVVESTARLAVAEEKQTATQRAAGDEVSRTIARLDKRVAAERQFQNELARVARWRQEGTASEQQQAQVIDLATRRLEMQMRGLQQYGTHLDKATTSTGLMRHEMINLSRQAQDVFVTLQSGQPILTIFMQQGTQIADIFLSSGATLRGFATQAVAGFARFATSTAGVVTGLAAIAAAAVAAALSWREGQREIERSLIGIGEASGLTVEKVNQIAEAASSSTRLSTSGAREAAMEFIKTGRIYEENIGRAVQLTDKFALAIGKDTTTAAKEFADILSDVGKGADTLGTMFGALDGKTRGYIESLVRANRTQEAQKALMDAYEPTITKAAEATSVWTRAWMGFTKALSDAYDMMGKAISRSQELPPSAPAARGDRSRQGSPGRVMAQGLRAADDEALAFGESQQRLALSAKAAEAALQAENQRLKEFANEADAAVKAIIPNIDQLKKLEGALNDLERAQADARVSGRMEFAQQLQPAIDATRLQIQLQKESQAEIARQVTAVTELAAKYNNVSIEVAKMLESLKDQTAIAEAVPGPEKAAAEDQARMNQLRLEGKSIIEATAITEAERALKIAQANAAIEQQNHALAQGADLARASIEGRGDAVKVEQARTDAIRAGTDALGAQAAAEGQAKANSAARLNQEILATREFNAQLMAINARTAGEREAVAAVQAYNQSLAQGQELWQAQAAAARAVTLEVEKMAAAHRDVMASLQEQLAVAQATTEEARRRAQYQADVGSAERAGFTPMQAEEQAAMKRKIADEQAAQAARKAAAAMDKAASASENVYRVWAYGVEIFTGSARELAQAFYGLGSGIMDLKAKLAGIGTVEGAKTRGFSAFGVPQVGGTIGSRTGPLVGAAGMSTSYVVHQFVETAFTLKETADEAARKNAELIAKQQEAAQTQMQAAAVQQQAAEQQKAAAEAARQQNIAFVEENVAGLLLRGIDPRAINALIEAGDPRFRTTTPSAAFQMQLDLYKRAGLSSAQIRADILAGIIGEGVKNSELLAALDSLTDAVSANTDAQMIGLSEFYTQQGDVRVGYRGFRVRTEPLFNIPTTTTTTPGAGTTTPGTGTTTGSGMGGVVNPNVGGAINVFSDPKTIIRTTLNPDGSVTTFYLDGTSSTTAAPSGPRRVWHMEHGGIMSAYGSLPLRRYQQGGIAYDPQMALFGEGATPEAFVPLRDGAIPVKLIQPPGMRTAAEAVGNRTEININAPLVNFMAEPTVNEVRESAFQAAQFLRRAMAG
jgi:hypothetical protein